MYSEKTAAIRLLKTARGQLDGILRMVEEDKYCIDISNQIIASEAVLRKANQAIIRSHLLTCVKSAMESGDEAAAHTKMDEIVGLMQKLSK